MAAADSLKLGAGLLSPKSVGVDSLAGTGGGGLGAAGLATGNPYLAAGGFALDMLGGSGMFGGGDSSSATATAASTSGDITNSVGGLNVPAYPFADVPTVPNGSILTKKALDLSPALIGAAALVAVLVLKKRSK